MTKLSRGSDASPRFNRVQAKFQAWRKKRSRGARIPQPLWDLAARVAADVGVCRAAKTLKLDYYKLRRLVREQELGNSESPGVSFVELPGVVPLASGECIIELENAAGASMRMSLKGADAATIVSLGCQLWKDG